MPDAPLAYVAGQFVAAGEACVPISDAGLLLGLGLYETLRTYGGRPLRLSDHLARLRTSAGFLRIAISETDARLAEVVAQLVEKNALPNARIRITVTAGPGGSEQDGTAAGVTIVTASPLAPYSRELYERGAAAVISPIRVSETDPLTRHKTTSRARQTLALREAHSRGAVDTIFLNTCGRVAEGSISNVFLVHQGRLVTPPPEEGLLPGITRAIVLELAAGAAVEAEVRPVSLEEFLAADEAFLTNSIMEVMPVVRIDSRPVGGGAPGQVTLCLAAAYRALVARETASGGQAAR
jgi:branched-subunit amino acid aminotransferase/4-amino-4-deoxychorismate lyase